jgi:chaperonin GroES
MTHRAARGPTAAHKKTTPLATQQAEHTDHRSNEEEYPMNVKPLADRLLVKRVDEAETQKGGIIIPDTAKEKPLHAEVVAVGPGRITEDGKRLTMDVKKGDKILIGKYSGTEVKIEGAEYVILREDDVLAVIA